MSNSPSVNDLLNGSSGPPAFKFANIGDTARGVITRTEVAQVRDFKTNQPRVYPDGNPIMQIVITIRPDGSDEETRIFCKQAAKEAIRDAVAAAGATGLEIGGRIAVQYSGDEPPEQPGLTAKKQFVAQYQAPVVAVSANDLLG